MISCGWFWYLWFSEFLSIFCKEQLGRYSVDGLVARFFNEIATVRDVAPLVTAAQLDDAIVSLDQLSVVVRLKQSVKEFREWQSGGTIDSLGDVLFGEKGVHAEQSSVLRHEID